MFWKRKKAPAAMLSAPRKLHYTFAHRALREICAEDPLQFFSIMATAERDQFVAWLCARVQERSGGPDNSDDTLNAQEIVVATLRLANFPAILVTMPTPRAAAEAHFIGVVLTGALDEDNTQKALAHRYFTLECGINLDSTLRTVMCEWADGSHLNYGDGPPATSDAFLQAMTEKLQRLDNTSASHDH